MCIGMANGEKTPKMTDEQIKKALECCVTDDYDESCAKCPMLKHKPCDYILHKNALDLINRQQAEIKRLRNQCFKFNSLVERAFALCDDKDKQLETLFEVIERWKKICKNERFLAYREFARELKNSSFLLTHKKINRILKRMVGEQK